jgi:uncharacterized protein YkwD
LAIEPSSKHFASVVFAFLTAATVTVSLAAYGSHKNHAPAVSKPQKQIFEASHSVWHSQLLNADGVAAYVVSAAGTNRGFLIKDLSAGLANTIGMGDGDVLFSFDGHVVQEAHDVDRVLAAIPSGDVRVMFVHPSETGLQLYNGLFRYTNMSANIVLSPSPAGSAGKHGSGSTGSGSAEGDLSSSIESYVIELVNQDRKKNGGLPPVHANGNLTGLARQHAKDMMKRDFFAHINPEGKNPQDRAREAGVRASVYENIAFQVSGDGPSNQANQSEAQFMNEPPNQRNHRGNILHPEHISIGVGVVVRGRKMVLVQEFADNDP